MSLSQYDSPLDNYFSDILHAGAKKFQLFTFVLFVEHTILVHSISIDEGVGNTGVYLGAVVGCPAAFIVHVFVANGLGSIKVHDGQIGVVAFANEASAVNLVE